ncbi:hypothetical protein FHG87_019614 [Trinorchestia longiramus]|nr:hypothetical protein FHG87_019614 [Trinorchestia longiramus]
MEAKEWKWWYHLQHYSLTRSRGPCDNYTRLSRLSNFPSTHFRTRTIPSKIHPHSPLPTLIRPQHSPKFMPGCETCPACGAADQTTSHLFSCPVTPYPPYPSGPLAGPGVNEKFPLLCPFTLSIFPSSYPPSTHASHTPLSFSRRNCCASNNTTTHTRYNTDHRLDGAVSTQIQHRPPTGRCRLYTDTTQTTDWTVPSLHRYNTDHRLDGAVSTQMLKCSTKTNNPSTTTTTTTTNTITTTYHQYHYHDYHQYHYHDYHHYHYQDYHHYHHVTAASDKRSATHTIT